MDGDGQYLEALLSGTFPPPRVHPDVIDAKVAIVQAQPMLRIARRNSSELRLPVTFLTKYNGPHKYSTGGSRRCQVDGIRTPESRRDRTARCRRLLSR